MADWFTISALLLAGALTLLAVGIVIRIVRASGTQTAPSRLMYASAVWVVLGAIALGGVGGFRLMDDGSGSAASVALRQSGAENTGVETNELVTALEEEGIDVAEGVDPSTVEGALAQGASGQPGGAHDHGQQPTFTQIDTMTDDELLPLFPAGTVTKADIPAMREQIKQARALALELNTPERAAAAGYVKTTSDVPFMGQHYLNFDRVRDGKFNAAEPEGLLFSKIDSGTEKLVGVWYLQVPGIGGVQREVEPVGFASDLDLWHAHVGLCLVGFSGASEGETKDGCDAKGGRFTADLRWMMHLWVAPEATENQGGIMAYLNNDLYEKQQAAAKADAAPSGVTP